ncbi:MAG: ATP-grasp domain-containing protein [Planctomycetales bacterium]
MLRAVVEDFTSDGADVWTVWHSSWGAHPFSDRVRIAATLEAGLEECDTALVIAPESEGVLEQLTRQVEHSPCQLLGCRSAGVHLAADKWALFQHFEKRGIATLPTELIGTQEWNAGTWSPGHFPCVLKPRFGAGSQDTYLLRDRQDLDRLRPELMRTRSLAEGICQPYFDGDAVSVGVWCDTERGIAVPFPMATQHLSDDDRLRYRGGILPSPAFGNEQCEVLAAQACHTVPGLRGYVGVDLIVPAQNVPRETFHQKTSPHSVPRGTLRQNVPRGTFSHGASTQDVSRGTFVVEINPRLTTSYVGYRQLAKQNLSHCWREPAAAKLLEWRHGCIQFDPAGDWKWLAEGGRA